MKKRKYYAVPKMYGAQLQPRIAWRGGQIHDCELCMKKITNEFYYGMATTLSKPGIMCPRCHSLVGSGGGQKYTRQPNGKFQREIEPF